MLKLQELFLMSMDKLQLCYNCIQYKNWWVTHYLIRYTKYFFPYKNLLFLANLHRIRA